jgi:ATP-dependent exoDNAse (exonuclease V) alpha subunit
MGGNRATTHAGSRVFRSAGKEERAFSAGDRIQFTAPPDGSQSRDWQGRRHQGRGIALFVDEGRSVRIDPAKHPHLDHGYAVTSHSSPGADG